MHDEGQSMRGVRGGRWRGWAAIGLIALLMLGAWIAANGTAAELPVLLLSLAGLLALGFLGFGSIENLWARTLAAEELAREAEDRLEVLSTTCGEGVLVLDRDGILLSLNAAAERIFGYPVHEATGSRAQMLIADLEVRDGTPALARELLGRRRDGVEVPLEIDLSPQDAEGRRFLVVREAGRLRAAEALARAAEDERRSVASAAIEAILVFDREGRIQEANPAAEHLIGKTWSHLSGRDLFDTLLPRDLRPPFKRDLKDAVSGAGDRLSGRVQALELWITGKPAIRARLTFAQASGRWFAFVQPEVELDSDPAAPVPRPADDGRPKDAPAIDADLPMRRVIDERRDGRAAAG